MMENKELLIQLIINSLDSGTQNLAINNDTKLIEDLGFDSVSILYLLTSIEKNFNLDFSECDDIIEVFETVGSLLNYIEGCHNGIEDKQNNKKRI